MLKKRIIPCLDIKDNKIVKGINFVNLKDAGDPLERAKYYYEEGADEICILDITATHYKENIKYELITKIAQNIFIPLTFGGGINNLEDARKILYSGADKISINSAAILNPYLISDLANNFGSQAVVIAIDAKKDIKNNQYYIYRSGGRVKENIEAVSWAKIAQKLGAGEILLTSMDRDGTKSGYDEELVNIISQNVDIPIIASGGANNKSDFLNIANAGADAMLAASIFHFNEYRIKDIKLYLSDNNINVRYNNGRTN